MHLHFFFSSLICSSTLHANLLYMVTFTYGRYYSFVLFVNPKTTFIKLQVCMSLNIHHLFVAVGSPVSKIQTCTVFIIYNETQ